MFDSNWENKIPSLTFMQVGELSNRANTEPSILLNALFVGAKTVVPLEIVILVIARALRNSDASFKPASIFSTERLGGVRTPSITWMMPLLAPLFLRTARAPLNVITYKSK